MSENPFIQCITLSHEYIKLLSQYNQNNIGQESPQQPRQSATRKAFEATRTACLSSGLSLCRHRSTLWLVLLGIAPFDCKDLLDHLVSVEADVVGRELHAILSFLDSASRFDKSSEYGNRCSTENLSDNPNKIESAPNEQTREETTIENVCTLLSTWLHCQITEARRKLKESEIEQIEKDVLRSGLLYPKSQERQVPTDLRNKNCICKRQNGFVEKVEGTAVEQSSDSDAIKTLVEDVSDEVKTIKMEADEDNNETSLAVMGIEIENKKLLKNVIGPPSVNYVDTPINEWNASNVLSCVIEIVISRHSQSRGLMYTQGLHEATIMILRVNGIFELVNHQCDNKIEIKTDVNHQMNLKLENQRRCSLLILSIFKSILMLERICLHHLSDFLSAPLELSMISYLKIVGFVLAIIDPPLFSLLTFVSHFDVLRSGKASYFLSRQSSQRTTQQTTNQLPSSVQPEFTSLDNMSSKNPAPVFSRLSSKSKSQSLPTSDPSSTPSILPIAFQFLSGHEFQFCLSWLLTYFSHELLPSLDTISSDVRYQLCSRLWDVLLAGPPQLAVCLCASITHHPLVRKQLVKVAERFGIIVEGCPGKCRAELDSDRQNTSNAFPVIGRNFETQQNQEKRFCKYPVMLNSPIERKEIEDSNLFLGLRFDEECFVCDEVDFMQIEIFKVFQMIFHRITNQELSDLTTTIDSQFSNIDLVEVFEESICEALRLVDRIDFNQIDEHFTQSKSTLKESHHMYPGEMLHNGNRINWRLIMRLTSIDDFYCEVPIYSSLRNKEWEWRNDCNSVVRLLLENEINEKQKNDEKKEESVSDLGLLVSYTPPIYQFAKQDYSELLENRRELLQQRKLEEEAELEKFLQSRQHEREQQPRLWSTQRKLFISLLSNRLIDLLINEWVSISKRLALAFHQLISIEQHHPINQTFIHSTYNNFYQQASHLLHYYFLNQLKQVMLKSVQLISFPPRHLYKSVFRSVNNSQFVEMPHQHSVSNHNSSSELNDNEHVLLRSSSVFPYFSYYNISVAIAIGSVAIASLTYRWLQ